MTKEQLVELEIKIREAITSPKLEGSMDRVLSEAWDFYRERFAQPDWRQIGPNTQSQVIQVCAAFLAFYLSERDPNILRELGLE